MAMFTYKGNYQQANGHMQYLFICDPEDSPSVREESK